MGVMNEFFRGLGQGFLGSLVGGNPDGVLTGLNGSESDRIGRRCRDLGWEVDERDGNWIKLHFKDPLVGIRKVWIHGGDEALVVFNVYSHAVLAKDEVPDEVVGHLLVRNGVISTGAWGVSVDDDGDCLFFVKYYALGNGVTAPVLKYICDTMIREAAAFDRKMQAAGLLRTN
jgi:hypothetical protein